MKPYLIPTKLVTDAEKTTGTRLEVLEITEAVLAGWERPPSQRPLKTNSSRFIEVIDLIREDGVIPGVLTLAVVDKKTYVLDGQHRLAAFKATGIPAAYADVRIHHFNNMAEAGQEWVRLQTQITKVTPDDVLRGLEGTSEALTLIRKRCPFVGYDHIRKNPGSPIVSMSMVVRAWRGSAAEVPVSGGTSALEIARTLTIEEAEGLTDVLCLFLKAWGRDPEYWKLWSALNVGLCMWLWRRTVVSRHSIRSVQLTKEEFRIAAEALSASSDYLSWLTGRCLRDADRSPAYARIRTIMAKRLALENKKALFPAPAWYSGVHK